MKDVFICDAIRTPVGKYAGSLSGIRTDDLASIPLKELMNRNTKVNWNEIDDVILGCANQAGEDNRNVARMALLLAGFSESISGVTVNRLCGSGMDAIGSAARAIKSGESDFIIAGGVESMSRAPFVVGKSTESFSRDLVMQDTTLGWRFINKKLDKMYGTESMAETAENIAREFKISREDQDKFAFWSQEKARVANENGSAANEIIPVTININKSETKLFDKDEHPRKTSLEKLSTLKPITTSDGRTITAGNASGINDGAAALIIASEEAAKRNSLVPKVKVLGMKTAGVPPRTMGMGPVPATNKLLKYLNLTLDDFEILEINEAFAAQILGCTRELGLKDDDPRINPLGGAIAIGHPLGMSGARLVTTAFHQLLNSNSKRALCAMCIGVGQGIAIALEKN